MLTCARWRRGSDRLEAIYAKLFKRTRELRVQPIGYTRAELLAMDVPEVVAESDPSYPTPVDGLALLPGMQRNLRLVIAGRRSSRL